MIKFIVHLVILLALFSPVSANVSRIYKDHFFSGNINLVKKADCLKLIREDMKAVFPLMELDNASLEKKVDMHISYIIENRSDSTIEIPLQFLGIDVYGPQILINDKLLSYSLGIDKEAERNFLVKITEHRYKWNRAQYEQYFMLLDYINSGKKTTRSISLIQMTLPEFIRTARGVENLNDLFPGIGKFSNILFNVRLLPGKNNLTIKYQQGMYVDGRTSYSGGPVFVCGFEYLLYPAFTWEIHPDFELFVSVTLQDFFKKGWFWNSRITPVCESNLTFNKTYDSESRVTTFYARSRGFPAPVLAFIVKSNPKD